MTIRDAVPLLAPLLQQSPLVHSLVVVDGVDSTESLVQLPLTLLQERGRRAPAIACSLPHQPDSTAVLMLVADTTSDFERRTLTHEQLLKTIRGFSDATADLPQDGTYMSCSCFKPVPELAAVTFFASRGYQVGFAARTSYSPWAPLVKHGQEGDPSRLRPTVTSANSVERWWKGVMEDRQSLARHRLARSRRLFEQQLLLKTWLENHGASQSSLDRLTPWAPNHRRWTGGRRQLVLVFSEWRVPRRTLKLMRAFRGCDVRQVDVSGCGVDVYTNGLFFLEMMKDMMKEG